MKTAILLAMVWLSIPMTGFSTCNYPCEIDNPDESQRWAVPCVDAPEGTTITNEPCKECDGAGQIRNKDDGVECMTSDGKEGKCCLGECIEIPTEGEDPCEWARNHTDLFDPVEQAIMNRPHVLGYVLCIFGDMYDCVFRDRIESRFPNDSDRIAECIRRHEENHRTNTTYPAICPPCGIGMAISFSSNESECDALLAEYLCYFEGTPYSDAIWDIMQRTWDEIFRRGCPNIPDLPDPINCE